MRKKIRHGIAFVRLQEQHKRSATSKISSELSQMGNSELPDSVIDDLIQLREGSCFGHSARVYKRLCRIERAKAAADIEEIQNGEQHKIVLKRIEDIFFATPGTVEGNELERLSNIVEDYENIYFPLS